MQQAAGRIIHFRLSGIEHTGDLARELFAEACKRASPATAARTLQSTLASPRAGTLMAGASAAVMSKIMGDETAAAAMATTMQQMAARPGGELGPGKGMSNHFF